MRTLLSLLLFFCLSGNVVVQAPPQVRAKRNAAGSNQNLPACSNPWFPIENRIADLLSRMTIEEKAAALVAGAPATVATVGNR